MSSDQIYFPGKKQVSPCLTSGASEGQAITSVLSSPLIGAGHGGKGGISQLTILTSYSCMVSLPGCLELSCLECWTASLLHVFRIYSPSETPLLTWVSTSEIVSAIQPKTYSPLECRASLKSAKERIQQIGSRWVSFFYV